MKGQVAFYKDSRILGGDKNRSMVPNAIIDINGDHLDDIIVLDNGTRLKAYFQTQEPGVYFPKDYGMVSGSGQFALAAADLDNDGWKEIFVGGLYDGVKIYKSFENGPDYLQWDRTSSDFYTQNISFVDYDNNGFLDLHINDDDNFPKLYSNQGGDELNLVDPFKYEIAGEMASGNYGSVWTDFDNDGDQDLYISKCRLGVAESSDLRRINQLWINEGDSGFIEVAADFGLDIGEQTWVSDFVDLDNDGDKDLVMLNHTDANYIFENVDGRFEKRQISEAWEVLFEGLQLIVRDFDNDGLKDILIAGFESKLFWNRGEFQFEEDASFLKNQTALTLSTGDLNEDGFWDLYAGFAFGITESNQYVEDEIWLNNGNENNFLKISLEGVDSNKDGVGAACSLHGVWGIQILEVRSGESYGINNSQTLHFGIGREERYDSLVIKWPSGRKQVLVDLAINKHHLVQENNCINIPPEIIIKEDLIKCFDEEGVLLSAPFSNTITWSNGSLEKDISIDQGGFYWINITDVNGCDHTSQAVYIRDEASIAPPHILDLHPMRLYCYNEVVTLSTQYDQVYWNGNEESQALYALAQDTILASLAFCNEVYSDPYTSNIADFPGLEAQKDSLAIGSDAIFTMNTLEVDWFADTLSSIPIASGRSFTIENLKKDTTLYASQRKQFKGGDTLLVEGSVESFAFPNENINGGLIFSVEHYNTTLKTIKCFADTSAVRRIQLKDVWGNIINEKEVLIGPSDSIVELNFNLLPSSYYLLTTDRGRNLEILGSRSPRLKSSTFTNSFIGQKSLQKNVTIRGSTGGDKTLYSFYDLTFLDYDFECESQRVPYTITINQSSATDETHGKGKNVSPNPFRDEVYLKQVPTDETAFQLLSVSGQVLESGLLKAKLDFSGLPPGIYFLRIGETVSKLVKL